MSDMDSRLRETFRTFTDAELVDMVLDHSGEKSPKSQRIARQVLDERGLQPIDYPAVIEEAQASGEMARLERREPPLPRAIRYAGWIAAAVAVLLGYLLTRELVLAGFIGGMAWIVTTFLARATRKRYLQKKGLGHALKT